jgi:hypothetical protein
VEVLKVQNQFWFGNLALRVPDESESAATGNVHFFQINVQSSSELKFLTTLKTLLIGKIILIIKICDAEI